MEKKVQVLSLLTEGCSIRSAEERPKHSAKLRELVANGQPGNSVDLPGISRTYCYIISTNIIGKGRYKLQKLPDGRGYRVWLKPPNISVHISA